MFIWEMFFNKSDKTDKTSTLEANSAGLMASYVIVHLNKDELEQLLLSNAKFPYQFC